MKARQISQAGVSLLEVLVVMIVAGLASTIVFQGFSQINIIDRQFRYQNDFMRDQAMTRSWWRSSIEGIQPDYPDGRSKFKGTAKELSGLSTSSLGNIHGAAQPIRWTLEFIPERGTINLVSHREKISSVVQSWSGSAGEFHYYGTDGKHHTTWPPETGIAPQIPSMIEMRITHNGEHQMLFATPMGPKYPPQIFQNVMPGVG